MHLSKMKEKFQNNMLTQKSLFSKKQLGKNPTKDRQN